MASTGPEELGIAVEVRQSLYPQKAMSAGAVSDGGSTHTLWILEVCRLTAAKGVCSGSVASIFDVWGMTLDTVLCRKEGNFVKFADGTERS